MKHLYKTPLFIVMAFIMLVNCTSQHKEGSFSEAISEVESSVEYTLIKGNDIWVRKTPKTGAVIIKLNDGTECVFIKKGPEDYIKGKYNYWLQIVHELDTGWVFGSQTTWEEFVEPDDLKTMPEWVKDGLNDDDFTKEKIKELMSWNGMEILDDEYCRLSHWKINKNKYVLEYHCRDGDVGKAEIYSINYIGRIISKKEYHVGILPSIKIKDDSLIIYSDFLKLDEKEDSMYPVTEKTAFYINDLFEILTANE